MHNVRLITFGILLYTACKSAPSSILHTEVSAPNSNPSVQVISPQGDAEATTDTARGPLLVPSNDPHGFYTTTEEPNCTTLPTTLPSGLQMLFHRRGSEPNHNSPIYGLSTRRCVLHWTTMLFNAPPMACKLIPTEQMEQFYQRIRQLNPQSIRTRQLQNVSPHRGGSSFTIEWSDGACTYSDILQSEVLESSRPTFNSVIDLFISEYNLAH